MQVLAQATHSMRVGAINALKFTRKHPLLVATGVVAMAATVTAFIGEFSLDDGFFEVPKEVRIPPESTFFERASHQFQSNTSEAVFTLLGSALIYNFTSITRKVTLDSLDKKLVFLSSQLLDLMTLGYDFLFFNQEIPQEVLNQ